MTSIFISLIKKMHFSTTYQSLLIISLLLLLIKLSFLSKFLMKGSF